jgi:hypothetical protein
VKLITANNPNRVIQDTYERPPVGRDRRIRIADVQIPDDFPRDVPIVVTVVVTARVKR